jgi:ABC-type transporter lipoprotein component MlaA
MLESNLLLEVGAQALSDLSADEKEAILSRYEDSEIKLAGQKVFYILMRKYKANYRMGRLYEDLSDKYEAYRNIYYEYARSNNAGRKVDNDSTSDKFKI